MKKDSFYFPRPATRAPGNGRRRRQWSEQRLEDRKRKERERKLSRKLYSEILFSRLNSYPAASRFRASFFPEPRHRRRRRRQRGFDYKIFALVMRARLSNAHGCTPAEG